MGGLIGGSWNKKMDTKEGVKIVPLVEVLCSSQYDGVVREEETAPERDEEANIEDRNDYNQSPSDKYTIAIPFSQLKM